MQIIAILIGLVLLAAIAFYVSRPIVQQRRAGADVTVIATLEAQRDSVYSQIRELDMDHATGKMNDEDYQQSRTDLVTQATTLLKQIDGVLVTPIIPAATAAATLPASEDVEALIAARRKASASSSAAAKSAAAAKPAPIQSDGDAVEAAIAARRKTVAAAPPSDDVEALIAARRKTVKPAAAVTDDIEAAIAARHKLASPTCPNCGKAITPDDVFCSKCGRPLKATAH